MKKHLKRDPQKKHKGLYKKKQPVFVYFIKNILTAKCPADECVRALHIFKYTYFLFNIRPTGMRRGKVRCGVWTVCNHQSRNVCQNKSQIEPLCFLMFRNPEAHSKTRRKSCKEAI